MLFRDVLFVSALFASASAGSIVHLLARQTIPSTCQTPCAPVAAKASNIQDGSCDLSCICTPTFVSAVTSCVTCLQAAGANLQGLPPNFAQELPTECAQAGFPVGGSSGSGGSSGGSSSGTTTTGDFGGSSTTVTKLSGTTTGASTQTTTGSSSSGGLTVGKNGALGLAANFGVVILAAAAGVTLMA